MKKFILVIVFSLCLCLPAFAVEKTVNLDDSQFNNKGLYIWAVSNLIQTNNNDNYVRPSFQSGSITADVPSGLNLNTILTKANIQAEIDSELVREQAARVKQTNDRRTKRTALRTKLNLTDTEFNELILIIKEE